MNFVARQLDPPAEIDLFLVSEEIFVEPPGLVKDGCADEKAGAAGPEYRPGLIILPPVLFAVFKYPAPGKRIAITVDPSARGAGILKPVFLRLRKDLGLAGSDLLVAFK